MIVILFDNSHKIGLADFYLILHEYYFSSYL